MLLHLGVSNDGMRNAKRWESLLSNLSVHALLLFVRSKILKSGII